MREARFLLDIVRSKGVLRLRSGLFPADAGAAICRAFGGYTMAFARGCWQPHEREELEFDTSIEFHVAIEEKDWPAFRELAIALAHGQRTVYVVSPFGEVEVLPVPEVWRAGMTPEETAAFLLKFKTRAGLPPGNGAVARNAPKQRGEGK